SSETGNRYNYNISFSNPSSGSLNWHSVDEVFRIHNTDLDSNSITDLMSAAAALVGPTKAVLEVRNGPTLYNIPIGDITSSGNFYILTPSITPSSLPTSTILR